MNETQDLKATGSPEDSTFEDALAELEAIVEQLEAGNLPLAQAIAIYERGMTLARGCSDKLDAAELQVERLSIPANQPQMDLDLFMDEE